MLRFGLGFFAVLLRMTERRGCLLIWFDKLTMSGGLGWGWRDFGVEPGVEQIIEVLAGDLFRDLHEIGC